jgi:uncharacterized membrane protein YesL
MGMREFLGSFLSNDSAFGKIMTRLGVIFGANLMFIIFSIPVVTVGAAYTGVYHVMLKTLRGDGQVNPFKQFWIGFKSNFKQATIAWVAALLLVLFGAADIRICRMAGGFVGGLSYAIYAMGIILLVVMIYLFPTMAAFEDKLTGLIRSSLYFAVHRPFKLILNLFIHIFPMYLTYTDLAMQPLYAFIWATFGFGAVCLFTSSLLLPDFVPYLPLVDDCGDFIYSADGRLLMPGDEDQIEDEAAEGGHQMTEDEILEEMKKLGM